MIRPALMSIALGPYQHDCYSWGEGPAVVMYPSLGRPGSDFDLLAGRLAAAGYRALALQPRGIGASCGPEAEPTLQDYAADLWRVVDHIGLQRVHLLGHAFGNRVVRAASTTRPRAVRSLILLAAGGRHAGEPAAWEAMRRCLSPDIAPEDRLEAVALALFAPGNDATAWRSGWYPEVAREQVRAAKRTEVDSWWAGGDAPLLVIQGLEDRLAPPENGRELARSRPRTHLRELERAGHALLPEQPGQLAEGILAFLDEVGAADRAD